VGFCVGFSAVFEEPEADYAHENQRKYNSTQALNHVSMCSTTCFPRQAPPCASRAWCRRCLMSALASCRNASHCMFRHMNRLSYLEVNCDDNGWRDKVGVHAFVTQWQGMVVTSGWWCALGSSDQQLQICRLVSPYAASMLANRATPYTLKTKAQVASSRCSVSDYQIDSMLFSPTLIQVDSHAAR
jgi:hypothetical protein